MGKKKVFGRFLRQRTLILTVPQACLRVTVGWRRDGEKSERLKGRPREVFVVTA